MSSISIFPKKYFTKGVLPYWVILALDCVVLVAAGMWSMYITLGGLTAISSFWDYFYIWVASLPIFVVFMFFLRTYGGVIAFPLKSNILRVFAALILGGLLLLLFCEFVPNVIFPFRPAFRATALTVLVAGVIQCVIRVIARQMIKVDGVDENGKNVYTLSWVKSTKKNGTFVDSAMAPRKKINLCLAHMSEDGQELKYVKEAFDTNWVVPLGPNVNAFEEDLEKFVKTDDNISHKVVALSAGTAAIHLALRACGVMPGDEVIVQSFTFCASTNPVAYVGATPVLVDSEPETWNMDPELLEVAIKDRIEKTGNKPKAIIPVALYGMPYKVDKIMAIANKYGIPVIEDAAEGFGSKWKGRVLGTFGKYGVMSFNGNKMITTSGGGALICEDDESKKNIMWYATQAREAYPYYQHEAIGYNYRLSNVCAGIGRGQMTVVNDHLAHHRHVQELYELFLKDVKGITVHKQPNTGEYDSNYWLCAITIDENIKVKGQENAYKTVVTGAVGGAAGVTHAVESATTDCQPNDNVEAMRVYLDNAQIEARPVWKPMHKQPVFKTAPAYVNGVSESIFKVGLCLPAGPYVSDDDVKYICDCIKDAIVK